MKEFINDKGERCKVIYIVYYDKVPHQVITTDYHERLDFWGRTDWDFFLDGGQKGNLYGYESGMGGSKTEIEAPQFCEGASGVEIWMAEGVKHIGTPKNYKIIKKPIRLSNGITTSINPFKVCNICYSVEYCERCGHEHADEYCRAHIYEDLKGELRYIDNDKIVE